MANSPSGESMIARLARLVAVFGSDNAPLTMTTLARKSGLPISTTQRLVVDLLQHHFLERTPDGLRLGELFRKSVSSGPAHSFVPLRNAAAPMMESVHAVLREQVTLAVLDNEETLYLERVAQGVTATNITQKFARLPLLSTPSGLVLLAHQPKEYQEDFIAGQGQQNLRSVLAQARAEGFVTRPGIIMEDSVAISVPVVGKSRFLPAALTAVVPAPNAQVPLTVAVLRAASFAIAAALTGEDQPEIDSEPAGALKSRRL